jgi:cell fate regulator YaaT (PSP1 superfamily)
MCCLAYEHPTYKAELAKMPRLGARVGWDDRTGKVISHNIFRGTLTVLTNNRERVEVEADQVKVLQPGRRRRR